LGLRCWTFGEEGVVTGIAFQGKEFQVRIQPCKMGWDVLYTIELQRKRVQILERRDLGIYVRPFGYLELKYRWRLDRSRLRQAIPVMKVQLSIREDAPRLSFDIR